MGQKILFISDYRRQIATPVSCAGATASAARTGYKWLDRYAHESVEGLAERRRTPCGYPLTTPYVVRQRVIELRSQSHLTPGAKKICALLQERYPELPTPAISTINKILSQAGVSIRRCPKKRYDRDPRPPRRSSVPNELWSVDFKGQFKLGNDRWCYPLTVMDDRSRYLLGGNAQHTTNTRTTQAAFVRLF